MGECHTDTVLSTERLHEIYKESACYVTAQVSGITLSQGDAPLNGEVCTVYTYFEKNGVHSGLAFCAQAGFFKRLTQQMMCAEDVEPQDVEDFSKEYFNVLCGNITSAIFRDTKVAARFQIPAFCRGRYEPGEQWESWSLYFHSDQNEGAQLVHYKSPCPSQ